MPREGPAYPITPEWKARVRAAIDDLINSGEFKSDAEFAKSAGFARSTLSETLSKGSVQSTIMPQIHKALKWPEPLKSPPNQVLELVHAFTKLPDLERGKLLERLEQLVVDARQRQRR